MIKSGIIRTELKTGRDLLMLVNNMLVIVTLLLSTAILLLRRCDCSSSNKLFTTQTKSSFFNVYSTAISDCNIHYHCISELIKLYKPIGPYRLSHTPGGDAMVRAMLLALS